MNDRILADERFSMNIDTNHTGLMRSQPHFTPPRFEPARFAPTPYPRAVRDLAALISLMFALGIVIPALTLAAPERDRHAATAQPAVGLRTNPPACNKDAGPTCLQFGDWPNRKAMMAHVDSGTRKVSEECVEESDKIRPECLHDD
jgi:hypothetical protein